MSEYRTGISAAHNRSVPRTARRQTCRAGFRRMFSIATRQYSRSAAILANVRSHGSVGVVQIRAMSWCWCAYRSIGSTGMCDRAATARTWSSSSARSGVASASDVNSASMRPGNSTCHAPSKSCRPGPPAGEKVSALKKTALYRSHGAIATANAASSTALPRHTAARRAGRASSAAATRKTGSAANVGRVSAAAARTMPAAAWSAMDSRRSARSQSASAAVTRNVVSVSVSTSAAKYGSGGYSADARPAAVATPSDAIVPAIS